MTIRTQINDYIEYVNKPFSTKELSENLRLELSKVQSIVNAYVSKGKIKKICTEHRQAIYVRNRKYKNKIERNNYGYNYKMMKDIYSFICKYEPKSINIIQSELSINKQKLCKIVNSMKAENFIIKENNHYMKTTKKINYDILGRV